MAAVLVSLMEPGNCLKIKHLQMVKGMRGHGWDDTLTIPIVENKATEDAIADVIEEAVSTHREVDAVLIRRHGLYVWGDTWEQAKVLLVNYNYNKRTVFIRIIDKGSFKTFHSHSLLSFLRFRLSPWNGYSKSALS